MSIELPDARQLSDESLQVLRLRALRGIELGYSEVELAHLLGLCHETISRWWSAYTAAGTSALPGDDVSAEQAAGVPLILPEAHADARRQLDRTFREAGVRDRLEVVLEIGGWPAVLTYARRGIGVGIVTQSALAHAPERLWQRRLDPRQFVPLVTRLICHLQAGSPPQPDLTPDAALFAQLLREAADRARTHG